MKLNVNTINLSLFLIFILFILKIFFIFKVSFNFLLQISEANVNYFLRVLYLFK